MRIFLRHLLYNIGYLNLKVQGSASYYQLELFTQHFRQKTYCYLPDETY